MSSEDRKSAPLYSGVLKYFPDALLEVARLSKFGNDKHNPGEPLHWSKGKSADHDDCVARHLLSAGTRSETDGNHRHRTMMAWRALAALQTEIEEEREAAPMGVIVTPHGTAIYNPGRRIGETDRRKFNDSTASRKRDPIKGRDSISGRRATDTRPWRMLSEKL